MKQTYIFNKNISLVENISVISNYSLRFFFLFYIIFLPIGRAPREIGTAGCIISLLFYYISGYEKSNLKKYTLKNILLMFSTYIFINSLIFNIDPKADIETAIAGIVKGLVFLLVGMEFVKNINDIKKLLIAFTVTAFYQGLDGIYQAIYGYDFIRNTESWGDRLTGSLMTPRVGNLMSLLIPIAAGSYFIIKKYFSFYKSLLIYIIIISPAIFLLYGSKTRSGWVGFIVSILALLFLTHGVKLKKIVIISVAALILITSLPGRANIENILADARFELWETSLRIFEKHPITGSGFTSFKYAYEEMGFEHKKSENMPHPHNIYMQFLAEGGLVGFSLLITFLLGNLIWSYKKIKALLSVDVKKYFYIAFFWSSYAGYLATAISAHSFFRLWWLGMGMAVLGITLGGSLLPHNSSHEEQPA